MMSRKTKHQSKLRAKLLGTTRSDEEEDYHQSSLPPVPISPNSGIDLSPQDPSPERGIAKQLKYDTDSKAIKASVEKKNGEYIVKLTRVSVTAGTDQNAAAAVAAEQAQTAALLLSHGELFRALGENLLSQYRASSEKVFYKSLDLQATPRS